jgi:hypothetical protein
LAQPAACRAERIRLSSTDTWIGQTQQSGCKPFDHEPAQARLIDGEAIGRRLPTRAAADQKRRLPLLEFQ